MAADVQITAKKIDTGDIRYLTINGDNIDTVNFHFPRYYNGKDLSLGTAQLLYKRPDGTGDADLLTITTTETEITASWDIRPNFTCLTGKAYISVRVVLESNLWQSFTAPVIIERSIAPTDLQCEPTVFDQYLYLFEVIRNETIQAKEDAEEAAQAAVGVIENPSFVIVSEDLALGELSNIKIVAGDIDNINAVVSNKTNIDTVAINIADVNTVSDNIVNVNAVASNEANINTVSTNITHVQTVSANMDHIVAVENDLANIDIVSTNITKVNTVADNIAHVQTVSTNIADVNAVSANSININKVAAIDTDVTAVANINAQISALALITSEIVNVNSISTEVTNVSANMLQILGVYAKLTEITAVYGKIPEIDALYAQLDVIASKANQSDLEAVQGVGWTDENLVDHEERLDTLEGTGEGSVAKAIDDAVSPIDERISRLETQSLQIFGLDWDNDTDTYTRTDMAVGLNFGTPDGVNAIASDFDNYYPWKGIKQVKVDSNKNILAELGDSNYSSVDGEYMTLIPQFWFQDYIDVDNVRHIRIATQPVVGFYPAWLDKDGKPVEYRLVGRVPAGYDTELRSKPDMGIEVNRTYTSFITTAYAKGDGGWWLDDSATRHKLGLLMAVEAGDWDQKAKFGQGINSGMPYGSGSEFVCSVSQTGATSIIIPNAGATNMYVGMVMQIGTAYTNNSVASNRKITAIADYDASNKRITVDGAAFDSVLGTTSIVSWGQPVPSSQIDALGGGSGYILQFGSEARSHVSYRGIWDLWGNVWSFTYGFARYNGAYYVCFDQSKYNVADPRSDAGWIYTGDGEYFDSNGYQLTRKPFVTDQGSVDYVIVIGGGAGSGTFYAAYVYNFTATYDGVRILLSGGGWNYGGYVSLFFCLGSLAPGSSYHDVGSRLIG